MKIYTKKGDKGQTQLLGGTYVSKNDIRLEAYGTIDELNSFVGLLESEINLKDEKAFLYEIQNRLFDIGAILALEPGNSAIKLPQIDNSDVEKLEQRIDFHEQFLSELRNFILPGGSKNIARAHVCRTVCRRVERIIVHLTQKETQLEYILIYLNRLSDYFFSLSRYIAYNEKVEEVIWKAKTK
jgi:cob(I)alamin adenosyltransferase